MFASDFVHRFCKNDGSISDEMRFLFVLYFLFYQAISNDAMAIDGNLFHTVVILRIIGGRDGKIVHPYTIKSNVT